VVCIDERQLKNTLQGHISYRVIISNDRIASPSEPVMYALWALATESMSGIDSPCSADRVVVVICTRPLSHTELRGTTIKVGVAALWVYKCQLCVTRALDCAYNN